MIRTCENLKVDTMHEHTNIRIWLESRSERYDVRKFLPFRCK